MWVAAEPQPDSAADARPVAPPAPTDDEGDGEDELGALGGEPTRPALRRCRR